MKRLIQYALYQPLFIIPGTLVFAGGRLRGVSNAPVGGGLPDVTDTQVTVIAVPRACARGSGKAGHAAH